MHGTKYKTKLENFLRPVLKRSAQALEFSSFFFSEAPLLKNPWTLAHVPAVASTSQRRRASETKNRQQNTQRQIQLVTFYLLRYPLRTSLIVFANI